MNHAEYAPVPSSPPSGECPRFRDPALSVSRHAYIRVTTPHPIDTVVWLVNIASELGDGTSPVTATACRSEFDGTHVTEVVMSSSLSPNEAASRALGVHPLADDLEARAAAWPVLDFEWFVECVASTGGADVVTYDPANGVRVESLVPAWSPEKRSTAALIAVRTETAEIVHPRALDPRQEARRLEDALNGLQRMYFS